MKLFRKRQFLTFLTSRIYELHTIYDTNVVTAATCNNKISISLTAEYSKAGRERMPI